MDSLAILVVWKIPDFGGLKVEKQIFVKIFFVENFCENSKSHNFSLGNARTLKLRI